MSLAIGPSSLAAVLAGWCLRLHRDAKRGMREWAQEPEWPLLVVSVVGFVSFLLHWLGFRLALHRVGWPAPYFAPTTWEGRVGWRKPLVFGISVAMVFVSLRHALRSQQLLPRRLVSHAVSWSTAMEVGVITLQAWRGVPSHFNTSTPTDLALYCAKLCGVFVLAVCCFASTLGVFLRPAPGLGKAKGAALRHGLLLLCMANVVGLLQIIYGHMPREPRRTEASRCLEVTAGAVTSPCYEIYGDAEVKLAHFLPLHITEVLLLLAWATDHAPCCRSVCLVHFAAAACWLVVLAGLLLTFFGFSVKQPPLVGAVPMFAGLVCIPGAFIAVFLNPFWEPLTAQSEKDGKDWMQRSVWMSQSF